MSLEKVIRTLESIGLTKTDAQVYILLGKKGPQKARDIAKNLKIPKQTLYPAIRSLQSRGIITSTLEHPAKFSAIPLEKIIDLYTKAKTEEVNQIERGRDDLLKDWHSIAVADAGDQSPRFTVIEGRNYIYPRLKQMVEDTKSQLSIVSTFSGLARADQFGLLDAILRHTRKSNAKVKLITELSQDNLKAMKQFLTRIPAETKFEGRIPELGLELVSRMLIGDDTEAAIFVGQDAESAGKSDDVCLWTNSRPIVNSFKAVFDGLWGNSTDVRRRLVEIETGKPTTKTCVISNTETAEKKYIETIGMAKKEIILMASSSGLEDVGKNRTQLKERAENGVSVKIMAPITRDNLEIALYLSECCKVRHVPTSYLRTAIIDGSALFQFKDPSSGNGKPDEASSFEDAFCTTDVKYIEKIRNMLNDAWENAPAPSAVTVEEITKPQKPKMPPVPDDEYTLSRKDSPYQNSVISIDEKPKAITEQEVLSRIINAKRIFLRNPLKDPARFFGSDAAAVIRSPPSFKLPDMLLMFFHLNKKSTFGAEDCFQVHLWLETPKGFAYVPVAFVGDNARGMKWRKSFLANTPASNNTVILRKDELQIQMHGSTMFAGWTVPIPLFPSHNFLPPASVLFEGYGKLKTAVTTSVFPSGAMCVTEGNGLDAFVTFFHPESKYAGPATDGTMGRDVIMTAFPPPGQKTIEELK